MFRYVFTFHYIESDNSGSCLALPKAWVPATADTHAEPLQYMINDHMSVFGAVLDRKNQRLIFVQHCCHHSYP